MTLSLGEGTSFYAQDDDGEWLDIGHTAYDVEFATGGPVEEPLPIDLSHNCRFSFKIQYWQEDWLRRYFGPQFILPPWLVWHREAEIRAINKRLNRAGYRRRLINRRKRG